jgi:AraC-like DNA-binding protein
VEIFFKPIAAIIRTTVLKAKGGLPMKNIFSITFKGKKRNPLSDRAAGIIRDCKNEDYEKLTVRWLAEQLDVTPEHLSRVFVQDYNCSLQEYIVRTKINRGRDIVARNPRIKMADLAKKLGYSSSGYLNRVCARYCLPTLKMIRDMQARYLKKKKTEKAAGKGRE